MTRLCLWLHAVRYFPKQDPYRLWQMTGRGRHRRIVGGYDPEPLSASSRPPGLTGK